MQRQITIQLLLGSVKNDVRYIHHSRDGRGRGLKVDDEDLSITKGRPWQEPRLHIKGLQYVGFPSHKEASDVDLHMN